MSRPPPIFHRYKSLVRSFSAIRKKCVEKLRGIVRKLLSQAQRNQGLVSEYLLLNFAGVKIIFSVAIPLASFYTRPIYDSIRTSMPVSIVQQVHAAIRDLRVWRDLTLSRLSLATTTPFL